MLPLLIAGAAAPMVGSLLKGGLGVGKDTTQTSTFGQTKQYDPNAFQYGGRQGGADADAARYRWWADNAQTRGAELADFGSAQPNYGRANEWDRYAGTQAVNSDYSRQGQNSMAYAMGQRALGNGPSIAGMQAQQQVMALQRGGAEQAAQVQRAQMAGAASARGTAGVALAHQNAANNIANAQGAISRGVSNSMTDISNQAQINAANERLQAERAAADAYGAMRAGDQSSQGLGIQSQQANAGQELSLAGLRTGQVQYNAGLQDSQRARNDALTMGMTAQERGVRGDQLQGGVNQQSTLSNSFNRQQSEHASRGARNAGYENANWESAGSGLKNLGSGGAPVPAKAKGGPVSAGQPYLVGELGPELIVPRQSGTVIPNHALPGLAKGGTGKASGGPDPWLEAALSGRQADLAARRIRDTGGDVGAEVLRQPFSAASSYPAAPLGGEDAAASARAANDAMGITADTTPEQSAFERKLVGGREADNEAEAEKIRARFGQDPATAQWERSFGSASKANAGARDGIANDTSARDEKIRQIAGVLGGFFGGKREDGGPIESGKAYVVGERGPELVLDKGSYVPRLELPSDRKEPRTPRKAAGAGVTALVTRRPTEVTGKDVEYQPIVEPAPDSPNSLPAPSPPRPAAVTNQYAPSVSIHDPNDAAVFDWAAEAMAEKQRAQTEQAKLEIAQMVAAMMARDKQEPAPSPPPTPTQATTGRNTPARGRKRSK